MKARALPVILIHGFTTTALSNMPLHHALRKADFQTYNVHIPGLNTQNMRRSSLLVAKRVKEIKQKHACEKLQLVGISMGGLIGLHYLAQQDGDKHVDKFVTLGTPFQGVSISSFLKKLPLHANLAVNQMAPDSEFMAELNTGSFDFGKITSIGAVGDTLVPEPLFHLAGANNILSPHGIWPTGHYDLVIRKANHQLVIDELDASNPLL